jgi:spore coat protein CotH
MRKISLFSAVIIICGSFLLFAACTAKSSTPADGGVDAGTDAGDEVDYVAEFDCVFPQDRVVDIHIDFSESTAYQEMIAAAAADPNDKPFYRASFRFDDEEVTDVGVRLKGNSSLWSSGDDQMKSFKIHFEEYVDGQHFHHVDRLNLNNNFRDPSIMRERLAYAMADELEMVTPRTAYARVWVDDELHGVYTMVQQVDSRFLKERFGTQDDAHGGNLYKCYDGCPLAYWGEDPDLYQGNPPEGIPSPPCEPETEDCGLQLKTNEDDPDMNDFSDLVNLIRTVDEVLNGISETEALDAILDMEHYARFQAWTLAISSLDSYFVSAHNFYLYHRMTDQRFQFVPWDLNLSYGIFQCSQTASDPQNPIEIDLMEPCGPPPKPLADIIIQTPEYQQVFCEALEEIVGAVYSVADQDSKISALHALVGAARLEAGVMGQPAGGPDGDGISFTYQDYLDAQSHDPPANPGPGTILNLGFFNDMRMVELEQQMGQICP